MRTFKSLMIMGAALFSMALVACDSGGDDGSSGTPDASVNLVDASPPDAMGAPDATMAANAANLGKVCSQANPCGIPGYICLTTGANGFCTLVCGSGTAGDNAVCANMFPGPGTPLCGLTSTMGNSLYCAVTCSNANTACPTGLTCQDLFNAQGMAGQDGMKDLCAP